MTAPGDAPPGATEPIPVVGDPIRLRDTFAALRVFNYRLYFIAQVFANTGGWMQRVAIDWLVLELTGDVALVGLTVSLQFAPSLLFGAWAGVVSDRFPRRRVLIVTQSVGVVVNAVLATLVLTGTVQTWQVLVAAGVLGTSIAIDAPSRAAFITEMVGPGRLRNAISLNAGVFHLGGLVGPAVSGAMIVVIGSGWSIAVNACTAAVAVSALLVMRRGELRPAPRAVRARGQIREAIRYAASKPTIRWPIVLLAFVSVFGMNLPVLLAAAADDRYATGAAGYGLYSSLAALGAFAGALASARRRTVRLRGLVAAAVVYGLVTAFAGLAPWYGAFLAALVGLGVARLLFATGAEAMTQLSTNLAIRGRVMSFYLMVLLGGQAVGGVLIGWICERFGPQTGFVVAGAVPAIAALVIGFGLARSRDLRVVFDLRRWRSPLRIEPRRR
ncbi:MFS transporter [Agromyces intestinalis]|uniref:MFS transporter n=1 Tax=Agromyces intestinalis TaxID=2592652 RepID=A0A5C1YIJ7_9MICO|nr:MFS transporter [Agromyces intestinalis]QEO15428.1 MFS transporter [Agromyces intestinalis]